MNGSIQSEVPQLSSTDGSVATLKSVHIEGRLDGLMLVLTSRQSYRNEGQNNLETVYTFPVPWGATLLALNAEIAGHRLVGTVLEKKQATERYEQAIDAGDTPIMVEQSAPGLYTANLGNLQPGEEAVIEIAHAQLLRFEQGQIRITIPTAVAPRYGDAQGAGGLAPHESVVPSLVAEYPLTVQILLTGGVARGSVQSPSHAIATAAREDGVLVSLARGGYLDRDLVLLIDGLRGASFATVVPDGDAFAVLASFCPDVLSNGDAPVRLKVLVDCSGSMAGDSIQAARNALHEVLKELVPADAISYSRFGSAVHHDLNAVHPCKPAVIRLVASLITRTEADLGGTEMNQALLSTFRFSAALADLQSETGSCESQRPTDVLLITDGEIWGVDDVLRCARESAHRVFAIGVGSAPAESLLRSLAEQTGGACELVSPNQDIAAVILRMFLRLRAPRVSGVTVDWGQEVVWQSPVPQFLFEGDTLHAFARMPHYPARPPVLSWLSGNHRAQATALTVDAGAGTHLARMGGAAQFASLEDAVSRQDKAEHREKSLQLALAYQLVTHQTNLLLVHVRDASHKAVGLPALAQIAHMQAAGWGATGSVRAGERAVHASFGAPSDIKSARLDASWASWASMDACISPQALLHPGGLIGGPATAPAWSADAPDLFSGFAEPTDAPAFLRRQDAPAVQVGNTSPADLLQGFEAIALTLEGPLVWALHLDLLGVPQPLASIIEAMAVELGSRELAWAIVLHWLGQVLVGQPGLSRQAARIVRQRIASADAANLAQWLVKLTQAMGSVDANSWGEVRAPA
jgi:Ca-activated chloride channel family protein